MVSDSDDNAVMMTNDPNKIFDELELVKWVCILHSSANQNDKNHLHFRLENVCLSSSTYVVRITYML